jgi:hypothetical protein
MKWSDRLKWSELLTVCTLGQPPKEITCETSGMQKV